MPNITPPFGFASHAKTTQAPALLDKVADLGLVEGQSRPSPKKIQRRLRQLGTDLAFVERGFEGPRTYFPAPAELLESAEALLQVNLFLEDVNIECAPLRRLESALGAVIFGFKKPQMLNSSVISVFGHHGGGKECSDVRYAKGVLAGIMAQEQAAGLTRDRAAAKVADKIHKETHLATRISPHPSRPITGQTVSGWLEKFGGKHGDDGDSGRWGYLHGRDCKSWSDAELMIASLAKHLHI